VDRFSDRDEDIAQQVAENPDAALIPTTKQRLVRLAKSTKMPARLKIKLICRYLRLSQSEYAETYGIPVRTLQNW
jgi:DNA-binding transcriptional regulator YiaG